jgi:FkbM family methyltransferase
MNYEQFNNKTSMYNDLLYAYLYKLKNKSNCNKIDEEKSECDVYDKKFKILNKDTVISDLLRAGLPWERFMHKYFVKFGDKTADALDIGANIGTHTVYLSDNFKTVHAFEPQKKVFDILNENIKLNNITNVITYNYGLAEKEKKVKMRKFSNDKDENIGAINIEDNGRGEEIFLKRLDSLNLTNIKFIKMDVEGFEYFVLLGGKNTILQSKPIIIIELNSTGTKYREDVRNFFKSVNYKLNKISSDDYIAKPLDK